MIFLLKNRRGRKKRRDRFGGGREESEAILSLEDGREGCEEKSSISKSYFFIFVFLHWKRRRGGGAQRKETVLPKFAVHLKYAMQC